MAKIGALDRLKAQLLLSGLKLKDEPLFQIIDTLIDSLQRLSREINASGVLSGGGSSSSVINISHNYRIMRSDSRGIEGRRGPPGISGGSSGSGGSALDHVVMSDGSTPIPAPVDDGFGNFVYVSYTP